jgi:hypothetical protein
VAFSGHRAAMISFVSALFIDYQSNNVSDIPQFSLTISPLIFDAEVALAPFRSSLGEEQ